MTDSQRLTEAVRAACIKAALDAYEEGGVLGLCAEGRWEYAISTLQQLDLDTLIQGVADANQTGRPLWV
ncbi:MAG: acetyltransferase [Candidatus Competibacteraceae bacterium]|nr:acetyltransferase [Candidatus Competibacteraceae bacterium]